MQRKPKEMRWPSESADMVRRVPWRTSDNDPSADGEAMEVKVMDLRDGEAFKEDEREEVKELLKLNSPRPLRTKDQDYQQRGYT